MIVLKGDTIEIYPRVLCVLVCVGATVTFIVSYNLALEQGYASYPWLFLSSTINFPPASNIATFTIGPGSLAIPFIGYLRYRQLEEYKPSVQLKRGECAKLNIVGFVCSFICGIGGLGVAAIQVRADLVLHFIAAGMFFVGGMLYLMATVVVDIKYPKFGLEGARRFRLLLSFGMISSTVGLGIVMLTWNPDDADGSDVFAAACLEIASFACFMLVFASFTQEFKGYIVAISVLDDDELNLTYNISS